MKVDGPNPLRPASSRRKVGSSDGSDFASALDDGTEASEQSAALSGSVPATATSSLLALQGVGGNEGDAARERARSRAEELLRKLDQLRVDLLMGAIPRSHLIGLAQSVKTIRDHVMDPRLNDVLDEIDLRAQVELAKYDPYR